MGGGTRRLSFKQDLASCMHALLCVIPMACRHSHDDTAADEVLSVNEDEDAFQEDEVEEEAVRLNNEWLVPQ